jgi:two-component system OmpR family response regulator
MNTILVVDDDPHIRKLIKLYLENSLFTVVEAEDGQKALDYLEHSKVDLMIVDVMMPRMDGIELTEDIRGYLDIPILMVTSKRESIDKVKGYQAGTDDYLVKPFDPVELVLRVKSLLKRYNVSSTKVIQLGDVHINLSTLMVTSNEEAIQLKKKECELLLKLAGSPGRIFTRTQLIESLWGIDYEGDERTVDVHIKRLRQRLETFPSILITTIRGLGYRLEDQ